MEQLKLNIWNSFKRTLVYYTGVRMLLKLFIKPFRSYNKITDIPIEEIIYMKEIHNIKGIILDMDGTIKHYKHGVSKATSAWIENVKKEMDICLLSNANQGYVKDIAEMLNLKYVNNARKPFKSGFTKAVEVLGINRENILLIGDALIADVIGSKKNKISKVFLVKDLNRKKKIKN